ncbi:MAG: hypothetical protein VST68_05830 [Nitrospirota bacterium]|nr:hypothetical protein [Nitrospirota bacterium]
MDNLLAALAYILIFGGVYALAVWFGPRYKYSGVVTSDPIPKTPIPVVLAEPKVNVPVPQANIETFSAVIAEPEPKVSVPHADGNIGTLPIVIPETEANVSASLVNVDAFPVVPFVIPKPESNESATPYEIDTPLILPPTDESDSLEQEAFTQAVGMLKSKGMEGEAFDLEQEIHFSEIIMTPPSMINGELQR